MDIDMERRLAIAALLSQPDPPELHRGHALRLQGKSSRYEMLPMLAAAFVQRRLLALEERRAEGGEEVVVHAAPARPHPRMVRRIVARQAA